MGARGDSGGIRIGLSAVVMAVHERQAVVLTIGGEGETALPFGPFDPATDRTFELALRAFVTAQTGFRLGFVEQLYTFGDLGRASPRATPGPDRRREVSVGYLALTREAAETPGARWTPVFDLFPWEDRRNGPSAVMAAIADGLARWSGDDVQRRARADALFALPPGQRWNEERVLERYELLYEAGLVAEAARERDEPPPSPLGRAMVSDHRRILATGLGRLRRKLKYRPVLFDLAPETFSLFELQAAAEAISGLTLHKQNFRRGVERAGLVEPTGVMSATGGRPADLVRFAGLDPQGAPLGGLSLPTQR